MLSPERLDHLKRAAKLGGAANRKVSRLKIDDQVFRFAEIDHLTDSEIARRLHCSKITVRRRLRLITLSPQAIEGRELAVKEAKSKNGKIASRRLASDRDDPGWHDRASAAHKKRWANMPVDQKLKHAKIMSKAKKKFWLNEERRASACEAMSVSAARRIINEPPRNYGGCKWFTLKLSDGKEIRYQGRWELAFATRADELGIKLIRPNWCLKYTDSFGKTRRYIPDFYISETDEYAEVKGDHLLELQREKFINIAKSNPDARIRILSKIELSDLGIKIP